ncbi:MAG: DNA primase, partial [Pseudomonadota bacterium]
MALPASFLAELKDRIVLSDIIRPTIGNWDRKKSNPGRRDWWSPCPFHQEKTSSFHVDDNKGFYHCFGCGAHGSAIDWYMQRQNMSFIESVKFLADSVGLIVPDQDPAYEKKLQASKKLHDVLDIANAFFVQALKSSGSDEALNYLRHKRGLTSDIIKKFSLGYAPDRRDALLNHLASHNIPPQQMIASGLIIQPDGGGRPYDRFRGRITFPVRDKRGKIITFGGRALAKDAKAKYLNGPESEIFHKSNHLYNIDKAIQSRSKGHMLVCEGYMDVIALAAAGFDYAVAPMGTALTDRQIDLLWKYSPEPVLCFDGDKAGIGAAWRALDRILPKLKAGYSARFIFLPNGLDPDDFIKERGAKAFSQLIQHAYSLSHVLFVRETSDINPDTPERIAGLEKKLHHITQSIPDARLRELFYNDLSQRMQKISGYSPALSARRAQRGSLYQSQRGYESQNLTSHALGSMKKNKGNDSLYRLEAKIIGLYILYGQLMNEQDFDILSDFEPRHSDFDQLKSKIMAKFLSESKKAIEISEENTNISD